MLPWRRPGEPCRAPVCDASAAAATDRAGCGDAGCSGCPRSRDRPGATPAPRNADPAAHAPTARPATHRCRHPRGRQPRHWDDVPDRARCDLSPDAGRPTDEWHPVAQRWNSAHRSPCAADPTSCVSRRVCTRAPRCAASGARAASHRRCRDCRRTSRRRLTASRCRTAGSLSGAARCSSCPGARRARNCRGFRSPFRSPRRWR